MDIVLYGLLKKKIDNMGIDESKIKPILEQFMLEHPEYIGATPEQAQQIIENTEKIEKILESFDENYKLKLSKDEGNILENKTDGLYGSEKNLGVFIQDDATKIYYKIGLQNGKIYVENPNDPSEKSFAIMEELDPRLDTYQPILDHKLTIGEEQFDGSKDVTIQIYDGDFDDKVYKGNFDISE